MNKWKAKMRAEHRCYACGEADERTLSGKAYCTVCAEKNRLYAREYHRAKKRSKNAMQKISEIVRLATAEGLSYGQYVAKHRYDNRISNANEKEIK